LEKGLICSVINQIKIMKINVLLMCCVLSFTAFAQQSQFITVGKTKLAFKTSSAEKREPGEPIIVYEAGFGSGGGSFAPLIRLLPDIPYFAYDRNGLGESAIDTAVRTDTDVVKQLHDLLSAAKVAPPYLLVGHSLGGPFIRLYAATYPDIVCGLLFIDPTDFMLTTAEDEQAKKASGSTTGYIGLMRILFNQIANDSNTGEGVRNEAQRELKTMNSVFFGEYTALPPLKNIPVTVIISYAKPTEPSQVQMNTDLKLNINLDIWWKEYDRLRNNHYSDMIAHNQNSSLILLPGYSHGIHHQDPELVAKALRDLYQTCHKR